MGQRGKKSAAKLAAPVVDGSLPRLDPPAFLNKAERGLFVDLVNSCDARHFVKSDLPLLASFVQATLKVRDAARDPDKLTTWEKSARIQAMLATRLRLAPQSRLDPKTVHRRTPLIGPKPWEEE